MSKQEIIDEIRRIIGSKKFTFSDAYIQKCKVLPNIGAGWRPYGSITKKYVYCYCYAVYVYDENSGEYGYRIKKIPVFGSNHGEIVDKLPLEDLFTSDLQKILNDIRFYLWWEANVRLKKLQAEMVEAEKYAAIYEKMMKNHNVSDENEVITYGKMTISLDTKIIYE